MSSFFACGGDCPKGGDHVWDGPGIVFTRPCPDCFDVVPTLECKRCEGVGEVPSGGSATCSKCGLDAMSHSLMHAP